MGCYVPGWLHKSPYSQQKLIFIKMYKRGLKIVHIRGGVLAWQYNFTLKNSANFGVPFVAQWLTNLTRGHEVVGSIPGLVQWVGNLALP